MAEQFRITIDQLDKAGNAWRTFYLHPLGGGDAQALIARIERAYLMTATRVTIERPGQPAEVVGPYPGPAADGPTLSPDAAEQGPAADGPIITPELRRAVVRLAHADADAQAAAERVAELRTADRLDMTDPHSYAPDTRYAATHDPFAASPEVVAELAMLDREAPLHADRPALSDPAAAIVELIEQYGTGRVSAAIATAGGHVNSASKYNADADGLLDRIRRTLADALGTRRDREQYALIARHGGRPVACECGYGVFDSCPVHD